MGRRRVSSPEGLSARGLPRFFVPPETLEDGILPPDVAHQVRHVLRLREGDAICLLDNTGWAYHVRLQASAHQLRFTVVGREPLATELPIAVHILQAMVRAEKAEQVVRLCTAGGVTRILFAPAERSLVTLDADKRATRERRWQSIAREEAEVACRARYPAVQILGDWFSAMERLPHPRLLLDEHEGVPLLSSVLRNLVVPSSQQRVRALTLIIGPEGGFTPREREQMVSEYACIPVSLGNRVLRTEIAAFYALAQTALLLENR